MDYKPAIVVVAYNRTEPLKRLLNSIQGAVYPFDNINLVISIDKSDNQNVYKLAEEFEWKGNKRIIKHPVNLGLRKHILSCGDLSAEYGSVIILEDDLFASPYFYTYAFEALNFYAQDKKVAGISLFSYKYLENFDLNFHPYVSEFDTFYIQYPSSWGQAWSNEHWSSFKIWYSENNDWDKEDKRIPSFVHSWSERSWKKYFIKYLIEKDMFFIYPYNSYSTNFGEIGANEGYKNSLHQVNLAQGLKNKFSGKVFYYDAYFQINPEFLKKENTSLVEYDFDVDLFGNKPLEICKRNYVLTTRSSTNPLIEFGLEMYPPEINVINKITGRKIVLARKEDVDFKKAAKESLLKYSYVLSDKSIQKIQHQLPPLRVQLKNQLLYKIRKLFK